jgi:hypothetical protein
VAAAIADAPVLGRIAILDLSLGTLSDQGAKAILASPYLKQLKLLDLHHHYISEAAQKQLQSIGIHVNLDDPKEAESLDDRYVAVGE